MSIGDRKIKIDECLSLPETTVQSAVQVFHWCYCVKMTLEQCAAIIATSKTLAADLYVSEDAGDTCTREYLIQALTDSLGMRAWPCNGEGREVFDKFIIEFRERVASVGMEFVS